MSTFNQTLEAMGVHCSAASGLRPGAAIVVEILVPVNPNTGKALPCTQSDERARAIAWHGTDCPDCPETLGEIRYSEEIARDLNEMPREGWDGLLKQSDAHAQRAWAANSSAKQPIFGAIARLFRSSDLVQQVHRVDGSGGGAVFLFELTPSAAAKQKFGLTMP